MRAVWGVPLMACLIGQPLAAQTHLVIVSGLGGDTERRERFYGWAVAMMDAARDRSGLPDSNIIYLAERTDRDPGRINGRSTKENIEGTLNRLAGRVGPEDQIFVLLIGHGSYQGDESRFSLPGPDMTPQDFARLLERFSTQQVVLANTASASGDFISVLTGKGRIIITATKSAFERNETTFPEYFVAAFAADGADVDKDERVSMLEAFEYARREVTRFYGSENRLLTEHALLDDNGDGKGSTEPDPSASDGALASQFFLVGTMTGPAVAAADNPELAALYQRRSELQQAIAQLRARKDAMDSEAYDKELERLLLELARTAQAIRAHEGKES